MFSYCHDRSFLYCRPLLTTATFDAAFVRGALLEPQRYVRYNYAPTMPSYEGAFTPEDFEALVEYLQSLR